MTMRLGRIARIPLDIGVSWVVLLPLLAVIVFFGIPGELGPAWGRAVAGALASLALLGSVIAHEAGHVAAAHRHGMAVAGVTVFLFGGYSQIALEEAPPAHRAAVAAAGPAASLAVAAGFWLGAWVMPSTWGVAHGAGLVAVVNLAVAGFNLLPGTPLDGGRVLAALLVDAGMGEGRAERVVAWVGVSVGAAFTLVGTGAMVVGATAGAALIPLGMLVTVLGAGGLIGLRTHSAISTKSDTI